MATMAIQSYGKDLPLKKSTMTKLLKTAAASMTALLLCGSLAMLGCSSNTAGSSASSSSKSSAAAAGTAASASSEASVTGKHHVQMKVEGYEPVTIELDADSAPITVTNFLNLVNDGYYDGLTFYRFADGFCMQGGSAGNSAAANDTLTPIVGEFSSNGYENPLADDFDKGVVAMARTSVKDSATSTFFVTLGSAAQVGSSLNGEYAAFGTIDEAGMAIVDQIVADYLPNVDEPSMGTISDEAKQAKIESITVID